MMIFMKYAFNPSGTIARAATTARISTWAATKVCRLINRKRFEVAKKLVDDLCKGKITIKRKMYTKAARQIKNLLASVELNAKQRHNQEQINNSLLFISSHKGPTQYRARRRRSFGVRLKSTHVQAIIVAAQQTTEAVKEVKT